MTDRELLELAAKAAAAAGMLIIESEAGPQLLQYTLRDGTEMYRQWNPLADDADALRLAVKLKIEFYIGDDAGVATYAGYFDPARPSNRQRFAVERHGDDPYAATRRAIVRAAAEIGRAMT
jgi:hypothetical protein